MQTNTINLQASSTSLWSQLPSDVTSHILDYDGRLRNGQRMQQIFKNDVRYSFRLGIHPNETFVTWSKYPNLCVGGWDATFFQWDRHGRELIEDVQPIEERHLQIA